MENVVVSGGFDNIRSREVRFLEEASGYGSVHVCLWSDQAVEAITGVCPKYPAEERKYILEAVRYISKVSIVDRLSNPDELPHIDNLNPGMWVVSEADDTAQKQQFCFSHGIGYQVVKESAIKGFPVNACNVEPVSPQKKVLVTGCFDWFHSGHVRFFEETSALGDLYVVVGNDENVRLLKGMGHPLFPEDERRYMVGAIRYVKMALISSGSGWMDAEPEIEALKPDIYVVNEDGDQHEKREFCASHALEYIVLKRSPAAGLPRRESTLLRGF